MKRILFVKLGAIGDVIMAMAAVDRFLEKHIDVEMTWVCGREVAPLIAQYLPQVKLLIVDEKKLLKGSWFSKVFVILKTNACLRFSRWQSVITGYRDQRYKLLTLFSLSKNRRSNSDELGTKIFSRDIYHGDAYYMLLEGTAELPDLPIHPADLFLKQNTPLLQQYLSTKKIAVAAGGAKNLFREDHLRRYPIQNYRNLCESLIDQGNEVMAIGAAGDSWVKEYFIGLKIKFELGSWALDEVPRQLQNFDLLITHDSGLMHLGIFSNIPVVALFGPTRGLERVPRNFTRNGSKFIQGGKELDCAPCYDGRNYADCSDNICLKSVRAEDILKEILV